MIVEGDLDPVGVVAFIECSLFWGRFAVTKPLSSKHRITFLPLQDADPTPSFGGLGLTILLGLVTVLLGLGVTTVLVQHYRDDLPRVVSADSLWNGPLTRDDLDDGYGTSHSSKVRYTKETGPIFSATADRVVYGGRKSAWPCTIVRRWQHKTTNYYWWTGSAWQLKQSTPNSIWRNTGTPSLDYYQFDLSVTMHYGARVDDVVRYKAVHCTGIDMEINGTPNRHYLE